MDVTGAQKLYLMTTTGDDDFVADHFVADHVDWVEPRLPRRKAKSNSAT
jgi:hypothetical protein